MPGFGTITCGQGEFTVWIHGVGWLAGMRSAVGVVVNRSGGFRMETITPEWLDGVLEGKLGKVLKALAETRPVAVAEFVKLMQLERREYPPKPEPRVVIWLDRMNPPEQEPATEWDDSETKWKD
jgi:hypothetical protein